MLVKGWSDVSEMNLVRFRKLVATDNEFCRIAVT